MKKVLVSCLSAFFSLFPIYSWAGTWTCGSTTITTSGSTLTVSGNGAMADYDYSYIAPWISTSITTIVINDGVTHIGAYNFASMSAVTTITIPLSVTSIGEYAFYDCSGMTNVRYAGSPNDWASITFDGYRANPFVSATSVSSRKFFFNGCDVGTQMLTLLPGLTEIKDYAFYNAKFTDVNIPGSVVHIGAYALRCAISGTVCVNRATPPTAGTNAITYGGSAKLYVPSSAVSAYNAAGKPWKNSTTEYGPGATAQAVSGNTLGTYGTNVKWNLGEDGVLTLDASGASASKVITIDAASTTKMPWYYFRRLVHKIKLKGEITAVNNLLHYHYGIAGLIIDQQTIPSISATYIATSSSTPYASLFDPCHNLILNINLSTLLSSTEQAKLEDTAPWNDGHWDVALTDEVVIDENSSDNIEILTAIQDYIDVPFRMRLGRSLTNAYYNTFCSPIEMDEALIESTFGSGTRVHALTGTTYDSDANDLTLVFADSQNYIEAGVPYILWPANSVTNPSFANVNPADVATAEGLVNATHVSFRGTLEPRPVTDGEIDAKSFIFLQANNQLNWANTGTLKGMRAYWLLTSNDVPARALAHAPILRIGEAAQAIEDVHGGNAIYTKLIRDGKLVIIRDGMEFNAMGIRIQ